MDLKTAMTTEKKGLFIINMGLIAVKHCHFVINHDEINNVLVPLLVHFTTQTKKPPQLCPSTLSLASFLVHCFFWVDSLSPLCPLYIFSFVYCSAACLTSPSLHLLFSTPFHPSLSLWSLLKFPITPFTPLLVGTNGWPGTVRWVCRYRMWTLEPAFPV